MGCGCGKLIQLVVTIEPTALSLIYGGESNGRVLNSQEWNQGAKGWSDHRSFVAVMSVGQKIHQHTVSTHVV